MRDLLVRVFAPGMLLLAVASIPAARAEGKHPFGIDDYSALHSANAIDVSPDGNTILCRVSYDGMKGPTKRETYLVSRDGKNPKKLELPERFRPLGFMKDGQSLYGIDEINGTSQLAIVPLSTLSVSQILALPNGINTAVISPDGSKFVFLANPRPKDPLEGVRTVVENEETSLYVIGVHGENGSWWCPDLKYAGDIAWSSDGTRIAVASPTPHIGYHYLHASLDVCSASGVHHVAEIRAPTTGLAWGDGGSELVFASTTTHVLTPDHVWTVPVAGGSAMDRTPDLNGSALSVENDPHGKVWVEVHKGVHSEIDTFSDGKLTTAYSWPGGSISYPTFTSFTSSPEKLAFTVSDPTHASNIAVVQGSSLVRITTEGDETLASVNLGPVRVVHWISKDGTKLEGIATFPADYESGKPYPFLNLPHGGPEANDGLYLDVLARLIAGQGYVVLQPQYRGSTGYGSDFLEAIYQHFGDRAFRDVDSGTDYAMAQGWADPNHLAMFGWSAGGFMTAWTVTQTHRYRAAIEGAGITDWLSFIPTSDITQFDYDARLQENNPEPFLKFSAVMFANRVTTPLLILHGEADRRVPTFQGREFFILLAERGKTVRMVTYPGSPHFPLLAEQRRNVFQELENWLAKYNK